MLTKELEVLLNTCELSSLDYFRFSNGEEEIIFRKASNLIDNDNDLIQDNNISKTPLLSGGRYVEPDKKLTAVIKNIDEIPNETKIISIYSNFVGIAILSELLKINIDKISVKKGDILCTVEAMKIYNDIISTATGTLEEILIKNGDMVEFQQEIFRIRMSENE